MIIITSDKLKALGLHELDCSADGRDAIAYCKDNGDNIIATSEFPTCIKHKVWWYIKAMTDTSSPHYNTGYSIEDILLHASEYKTWEEFLTAYRNKDNHNYFSCPGYFKAYMVLERFTDTWTNHIDAAVEIIIRNIPEDTLHTFFDTL